MMIKRTIILLYLGLGSFYLFSAQTADTQSLLEALENSSQSAERVEILLQLSEKLLLANTKQAQEYAEEALKLSEKSKDSDQIGRSQIMVGKTHLRQERLSRAEIFLERALPWAEQSADVAARMDLYRHLAELYQKEKNTIEMEKFLRKYQNLQQEITNQSNQQKIANLENQFSIQRDSASLARLQVIQKQLVVDSALGVISQQEAILLRQSLDLANLEREAAQIEQEKLQALLALEREQQRLAQQRQQLFWVLAILVFSVLLAIGIWLYYQGQQARQMAQRERLEAERLRVLTAGIAHEIKNPLNFVTNFAEGSVEISDELEEVVNGYQSDLQPNQFSLLHELVNELKQNAVDIKKNGQRVNEIVRSMMDYASGSKGKRTPTDLHALLDEQMDQAYQGFRANHADFNLKIEKQYDLYLKPIAIVEQDVGRVLLNLINNACDALWQKQQTSKGAFTPMLTVGTAANNGFVIVRIRDNGVGIAPEVRDKIFTPFFTTKPTGAGNTGLGLSLSHEIIVKDHHGKLEVTSEPGMFTEFIITLPKK